MYVESARARHEGAGLWGFRERRPALLPQLLAAAAVFHSEDAEPPGGDHGGAWRAERSRNHGVDKTVDMYVCITLAYNSYILTYIHYMSGIMWAWFDSAHCL